MLTTKDGTNVKRFSVKWTVAENEEFESLFFLYGNRWKLISENWTLLPHRSVSSIVYDIKDYAFKDYASWEYEKEKLLKRRAVLWDTVILHLVNRSVNGGSTILTCRDSSNLYNKMRIHMLKCKKEKRFEKCEICRAIVLRLREMIAAEALVHLGKLVMAYKVV